MCFKIKGVGCFTCCNDVLVEQTGIHSTDSRLVLLCLMIHTPTSASSGRLYRCYISYVWLLLNQPGYSWLDLIPHRSSKQESLGIAGAGFFTDPEREGGKGEGRERGGGVVCELLLTVLFILCAMWYVIVYETNMMMMMMMLKL